MALLVGVPAADFPAPVDVDGVDGGPPRYTGLFLAMSFGLGRGFGTRFKGVRFVGDDDVDEVDAEEKEEEGAALSLAAVEEEGEEAAPLAGDIACNCCRH